MKQIIPMSKVNYKKFKRESIIDPIVAISIISENLISYSIAEDFDYDSDHQLFLSN